MAKPQNNDVSNLHTLHDYKSCPVVIPAIEITHDDGNHNTPDIAYAQIGRRFSTEEGEMGQRNADNEKASGEYADLLEEPNTKQIPGKNSGIFTCVAIADR